MPSEPTDSWAGQAILRSATITGPGSIFATACSMILSDSCISATRSR